MYSQLCLCVCTRVPDRLFYDWPTCTNFFYDHLEATVTIDLGMVRKCAIVGCVLVNVFRTEVKDVHRGEHKWSD